MHIIIPQRKQDDSIANLWNSTIEGKDQLRDQEVDGKIK